MKRLSLDANKYKADAGIWIQINFLRLFDTIDLNAEFRLNYMLDNIITLLDLCYSIMTVLLCYFLHLKPLKKKDNSPDFQVCNIYNYKGKLLLLFALCACCCSPAALEIKQGNIVGKVTNKRGRFTHHHIQSLLFAKLLFLQSWILHNIWCCFRIFSVLPVPLETHVFATKPLQSVKKRREKHTISGKLKNSITYPVTIQFLDSLQTRLQTTTSQKIKRSKVTAHRHYSSDPWMIIND